MHIGEIVRRNGAARSTSPAYTCQGATLTWGDVDRRVNQLAHALRRWLGAGDRVAILSHNCHRYWEAHFACAKAGLISIPLNHRLLPAELAYILDDAGARAWLVEDAFAPAARAVAEDLPDLRMLVGFGNSHGLPLDYEKLLAPEPPDDVEAGVADEDVAVLAFTSGTTGRPKGAMLSHHACTISAFCYAAQFHLHERSRVLACMPAYVYRGGSGGLAPSVVGCHTFVLPFDPDEALATIEHQRITWVQFAPAMLNLLLATETIRTRDLSSVESLWSGGAPIRPETIERLRDVFGDVVNASYGMTEATGIAVMRHRADEPSRLTSAGRPLPLVDVRIVTDAGDDARRDAGPDEPGEIWVRGDTVTLGYWNDLERTAASFHDGWFMTGDIGYLDDEGYLYIVDRRIDIINSGGINVYSLEVENCLLLRPGVADVAVVGIPDDLYGEAVAAFVVAEPGTDDLDADAVVAWCRDHLAGYKKPRLVRVVDQLPRNALGKVDKRSLRAPFWAVKERAVDG